MRRTRATTRVEGVDVADDVRELPEDLLLVGDVHVIRLGRDGEHVRRDPLAELDDLTDDAELALAGAGGSAPGQRRADELGLARSAAPAPSSRA